MFIEHTYWVWVCLDLSGFAGFGLHNNVENLFLNDDM
jgi:hypothetical protein